MSPVAQDIVVTGHDRAEIGLMIFPNLAGCRSLCSDLADSSVRELIADDRIRKCISAGLERLRLESSGSSTWALRAMLLAEPPSIDAGEITDKAYLNQRAILENRANLVELLHDEAGHEEVITLSTASAP
jgi:feruloyl-CoA synthase